jgi:RES domain-containing protein
MRFWRLTPIPTKEEAFSGDGARQYPGRWNEDGVPVVYVSSQRPLAVLEVLAHARPTQLQHVPHFFYSVDVPDDLIETITPKVLATLGGWNTSTPVAAQAYGSAWALAQRSLALVVPSVLISNETNALLNPQHPAAANFVISDAELFSFDPRLIR